MKMRYYHWRCSSYQKLSLNLNWKGSWKRNGCLRFTHPGRTLTTSLACLWDYPNLMKTHFLDLWCYVVYAFFNLLMLMMERNCTSLHCHFLDSDN
uniref:Uncharacterized protein n=1 Tax=Arundo donax TaxID=35708 RepID=A0A0A8XYT2_ARUDO